MLSTMYTVHKNHKSTVIQYRKVLEGTMEDPENIMGWTYTIIRKLFLKNLKPSVKLPMAY